MNSAFDYKENSDRSFSSFTFLNSANRMRFQHDDDNKFHFRRDDNHSEI